MFPEDLTEAESFDRRVQAGETILTETRRRRADGTPVTVHVAASRVETQRSTVTFVLYDDVTEAVHAREAERRLSRIVEATTDLAVITRPDGEPRYINRAGRRLLGLADEQDVSRHPFGDLCAPRDQDTLFNVIRMLRVFLSHTAERMPALKAAAEAGDLTTVERIAHSIKSSAGTIRADQLAELFRQLEGAAEAANSNAVKSLVADVQLEYARVVADLNANLGV